MNLPATPEDAVLRRENTLWRGGPRRIDEAALARSMAAWFDGADWDQTDAVWAPYHGVSVRLEAAGDRLLLRGAAVAARGPARVVPAGPGTYGASHSDARAVARVVIRGDAAGLYRATSRTG